MNEFEFIADYEIFPNNISHDVLVIYHGTSNYYSENIENNGFAINFRPFEEEDALELIRVLRTDEIGNVNFNNLDHRLENYLAINGSKSFTSLSSLALNYAIEKKGGQIISHIRSAEEIFRENGLENLITEPISNLFNLCSDIEQDNGVVYAVRLPENLEGISLENDVIQARVDILPNQIIGKILITNDIIIPSYTKQEQKIRNMKKNNHLDEIL